MSGLLRRLFAPRWKHPDPQVRRQAVTRLDLKRGEHRSALEQLVLDPDPGVRLAALARLEDPERLLVLLTGSESVPAELNQHLVSLLCGRQGSLDLGTRLAMIERLDAPELLAEIALQGDNQQLRLAALGRLDDEEALIRQACENGIAAVRQAAAARVESEAGLARLVQEAKRDRQVMRQARERLNRLRADAEAIEAARARREALLTDLERHARAPWEPLYAGRFRHLMREWSTLDELPDSDQERRYQEACLLCRKTLNDHEAQRRAQEADHQRREDADQTRQALLEAFEEGLEALSRSERITAQDIASLRSQKQLLANRWQALSDQHLADEPLRHRYDEALKAYERIGQAWVRLDERAGEIEAALEGGDHERLAALLAACQWPDSLAPTPLLARARTALASPTTETAPAEDHQALAGRLDEALQQLEQLLERGAFKSASRLHQRLRQQANSLPEAVLAPREAHLKRLGARLAELRDWRGFVAGPKRERLCEAIEALAETRELDDEALDRRHRQLVKEWKSLGDAAANREQSARFRSASERIHERLAPWRARLDAARQRNLETREALCEQLEALLASPADNADPDALRQIRDKAREQWRQASPVPRDQAEAIGRRFGRIRHALQALIDRRALEIAAAKRELIEEARALVERALPASRRAEQAKALQRHWRELGRAPKGEEQALWREFRSLCDRIFALREAERDDQAEKARERLEAMQTLVDRLDAWQPASPQDEARLEEAIREASALEPLPTGRRTEGMRRRWSGIVRARRERLARLAVIEQVQRWQHLRPLLEAHLVADAAALEGEVPRDVTPPAELALSAPMQQAHERRNAARHEPPTDVEERLARVRAHLSLLAMGRVSHRDDPLRLAIQVERLNEGLGREQSRAEEVQRVLADLLATGPVPPALWAREVGEFDQLLERLTRLPPP